MHCAGRTEKSDCSRIAPTKTRRSKWHTFFVRFYAFVVVVKNWCECIANAPCIGSLAILSLWWNHIQLFPLENVRAFERSLHMRNGSKSWDGKGLVSVSVRIFSSVIKVIFKVPGKITKKKNIKKIFKTSFIEFFSTQKKTFNKWKILETNKKNKKKTSFDKSLIRFVTFTSDYWCVDESKSAIGKFPDLKLSHTRRKKKKKKN